MKAWLFSITESKQYWGNQGYENAPGSYYAYDSFVSNYRRVAIGDIVIERVGDNIVGASVIDGITVKKGAKNISRCPECGNSRLQRRKTMSPPWKCENGHLFDQPETSPRPCILCRADYGIAFTRLDTPIARPKIEPALISGNKMFSIGEVGLNILLNLDDPAVLPLIDQLRTVQDSIDFDVVFSPPVRRRDGHSNNDITQYDGHTISGPKLSEARELKTLKEFLAGCRSEQDQSRGANNKTPLPISIEDFDQLIAEIDAAHALLSAPRLDGHRIQPLVQLLEKLKGYLDEYIQNAASSMGKATGVIAIAILLEMSGMLSRVLEILNLLLK